VNTYNTLLNEATELDQTLANQQAQISDQMALCRSQDRPCRLQSAGSGSTPLGASQGRVGEWKTDTIQAALGKLQSHYQRRIAQPVSENIITPY